MQQCDTLIFGMGKYMPRLLKNKLEITSGSDAITLIIVRKCRINYGSMNFIQTA